MHHKDMIFGKGENMDKAKTERYYSLLEQLVDMNNRVDGFDRKKYVDILTELAILLRLAKGVTKFYLNSTYEKTGQGDVMCDYDNGRGEIEVYHQRVVSPTGAVIKSVFYMSSDEPPLTDVEYSRLDIVVRSMLGFIGRNRLLGIVEKLGFYDEAGYPNMRFFIRHLERLHAEHKLSGKTAVCFNLRHFSLINKDIGRELGDVVIKGFINAVKESVGENGVISRIGGDNFTAIFPNEFTERAMVTFCGVPVYYDRENNKRVMVSASVGAFMIPDDFADRPDTIMGRIYPALQQAKQNTAGPIVYYDNKIASMREKRLKVQRDFAEALKKRELKVFYQPKVDVRTGEIVGAEALCRWFRDGKIVPPMEFIPILEQGTDICQLDFYMLDAVCRDIKRWLGEGRKAVRISVNFSRKHLVDIDLLNHIMTTIDNNDIPHKYVEIELTETTTDVEFRDLKNIVRGLQNEDIYTSVDDFGMGYSSLNLIREVPWNVLKIDKCFLPCGDDSGTTTDLMYKHVVSMAQDIGLECVTEGVETLKQVEILRRNSCHIAQGFFFDKPLPVEDFESRLDSGGYSIEFS